MIYHGEINQLMRGFTNSWLQISESPMVPLVPSSPVMVPLGLNPSMKPPGCHPLAILLSKAGARISPCQGRSLQSSKSCCDLAVTLTKLLWEREWECNPTNSRQFFKKGTTLSFGCLIYCIHTKILCYFKKKTNYIIGSNFVHCHIP